MANQIPDAARWNGKPTLERIAQIKRDFYWDSGDAWKGVKIGKCYGTLFHVTRVGLVPVVYNEKGIVIEVMGRVPCAREV